MVLSLTLPMQRNKLILLIGPECAREKQTFLRAFDQCHCVFAENGLRGLAMAMVLKPDVVVCWRDVGLIPASFIRHEILSANSQCKVLVLDDGEVIQ